MYILMVEMKIKKETDLQRNSLQNYNSTFIFQILQSWTEQQYYINEYPVFYHPAFFSPVQHCQR